MYKGTEDVEGTRHRDHHAFPIGHHRLTRRSRRDFTGAYTQLHTSLGVFSEPCACVPGHPVIFSDDHWAVPAYYFGSITFLRFGDWIPRVCGKVHFSWQTIWRNSTKDLTPCEVTRKKSTGDFWPMTHRIHGTGIFTYIFYIYYTNQLNVGKYTRTNPMDPNYFGVIFHHQPSIHDFIKENISTPSK